MFYVLYNASFINVIINLSDTAFKSLNKSGV